MRFSRTYELEVAPAPAMTWSEYERLIFDRWNQTLASGAGPGELTVHRFLEEHPSMVPGAFNVMGGQSGHYPHLSALVSQPPLPSYDRRIPDFMWLSTNSEIDEPVLIEIESPSKRWFTKAGAQTSHLTQALGQINEWKAWFGVARNVEMFKGFYGLDKLSWQRRRFRPAYVLIYGRRSEASGSPDRTQKRGYLHADDIVSMTFDRLRPDPKASELISVSVNVTGRFTAIAVPPTLTWSPSLAGDRAIIEHLSRAVEINAYIAPERKAFLTRRLSYWNAWATTSERGIIGSGDRE